jgi:hypothetical protein
MSNCEVWIIHLIIMSIHFIKKIIQIQGYSPCECPSLGENITILSFNFDGKGNASAIMDEQFKELSPTQIRTLMNSGWYSAKIEVDGRPIFTSDRFLLIPFPNGVYNLDENYELANLDNSPILTFLLMNYISNTYQENAEYTPEVLWAEYQLLKKNNQLNLLFVQEGLDNGFL